jgi:hypothetical protein
MTPIVTQSCHRPSLPWWIDDRLFGFLGLIVRLLHRLVALAASVIRARAVSTNVGMPWIW